MEADRHHKIEIKRQLAKLPQLLTALANVPDDRVDEFRRKWLFEQYSNEQIIEKRERLRWLWWFCTRLKPPHIEKYEELLKKQQTPKGISSLEHYVQIRSGDLIKSDSIADLFCEEWLAEEDVKWFVEWSERRLIPKDWRLPAVLAIGCMLHADKFAYCWNAECSTPHFIISRRGDQKYCSERCSWPSKRGAKLKWWRENRGKNLDFKRKQKKGAYAKSR